MKRRIRVQGGVAWVVLAIGALSAVGVVHANCAPTGSRGIDWALILLAVSSATWCAASAPWWAGVCFAAVGAALSPSWWLLVIGAVATVGGLLIGVARRAAPWSRALVAAIGIQVLARLGNLGVFGLTSLLGVSLVLSLAVLGISRRPRPERRLGWITVGVTSGLVVTAAGLFGLVALEARSDLELAVESAQSGLDLMGEGDFTSAQSALQQAQFHFDRADSMLSKPWTRLAEVVPVLAQHRRAAVHLVDRAATVTAAAADALAAVDVEALRVTNGGIDVPAISRLESPLDRLNAAVGSLASTIDEVETPWLVGPLRDRLGRFADDLDRQRLRGEDALAAVRIAPSLLGAERPRVYFVAFMTPAEARGAGGYMGNWAEVTIDRGQIRLTDFGRTSSLNERGVVGGKHLSGPQGLLANYGEFLLADPETGLVGPEAWSNITVSPDFPAVAQTIASLYPQSGGRQLDGVFALDIETVARLMKLSGPIPLADSGSTLDSSTAVRYLMHEQYLLPSNQERIDELETVARETMARLLTATLPPPPDLGKLLGPMVSQGRLVGWAVRPDEQAVFERVGAAGELPVYRSDALGIFINNAGGNKIDDLLDVGADYEVRADESTGHASAELTVTLTNNSPRSGLPPIIIDNLVGLPEGTNSLMLSVYGAMPFTEGTVDGGPALVAFNQDGEYLVATTYLDIPPGATSVVRLRFEGSLDLSNGYSLTLRTPGTARSMPIRVSLDGAEIAHTDGTPGVDVLTS